MHDVKDGGKVDHVGGRIVNVYVVVSTWVNADGQREILDMDVGASGVELVTSDAHQGLKSAIAAVFAGANWQRCRTHFMANLLTLIAERYERRSLGITSNLVFSEWERIFANPWPPRRRLIGWSITPSSWSLTSPATAPTQPSNASRPRR